MYCYKNPKIINNALIFSCHINRNYSYILSTLKLIKYITFTNIAIKMKHLLNLRNLQSNKRDLTYF